MLTPYLFANLWTLLGLWALVHTSDYLLPWWAGRYLRYADERVRPEVLRGNPLYLEPGRGLTSYLLGLLLGPLVLTAFWFGPRPGLLCVFGALFFPKCISIMRSKRTLANLLWMKWLPGSVEGGVRYTHAYVYRTSAMELATFGGFALLAFGLSPNPIFLGAGLSVLRQAFNHQMKGLRRRSPQFYQ